MAPILCEVGADDVLNRLEITRYFDAYEPVTYWFGEVMDGHGWTREAKLHKLDEYCVMLWKGCSVRRMVVRVCQMPKLLRVYRRVMGWFRRLITRRKIRTVKCMRALTELNIPDDVLSVMKQY